MFVTDLLHGKNQIPLVMGIVNVTPDSFSDGGKFFGADNAVEHALQLAAEGADIVDIGGESTRPGAAAVSVDDELKRVIPVIEGIRQHDKSVAISVDTSKPEVMQAAAECGVHLVNDVNALQAPGALETCAESDVAICLMHMRGSPRTMQTNPEYIDVVQEVRAFLQERVSACKKVGIDENRLIIDPGFGFGKNLQHNLLLLKHLDGFADLGIPVLAGISRKSMLGKITGAEVEDRLPASIAAAILALVKGAQILRVHDVKETVDAIKVWSAVENTD
jgi:dihydropteroate synthase